MPQAVVLDWEHEEVPPPVQDQLEAGLDVIVYVAFSSWHRVRLTYYFAQRRMADVTYNTASFSALIETLSRLIQLCKHKRKGRPPKVLMGYKERHRDERSLWDRAKAIDLHFQQIAQVDGAGGNPVEIWLG